MRTVPPHPGPANEVIARTLSGVGHADTRPELALRRILHARGLRYRVNHPVPTRPRRSIDIAFTRAKVAIFIDGCFWHGCPDHCRTPKSNREWWENKIATNQERDKDTTTILRTEGWQVLRFWEHEPPQDAAATVLAAIQPIPQARARCEA